MNSSVLYEALGIFSFSHIPFFLPTCFYITYLFLSTDFRIAGEFAVRVTLQECFFSATTMCTVISIDYPQRIDGVDRVKKDIFLLLSGIGE